MNPVAWELVQLLEAETKTAAELLDCLGDEQRALQQRESGQLENVVARKIVLLKEMMQHSAERNQLLERHGFSAEPDDIQTFIQERAPEGRLPWQRLLELATSLEKQNQINGSMIHLSQQRTQMAIDLITQSPGDPKTYGKQGYTETDTAPLTSVKA